MPTSDDPDFEMDRHVLRHFEQYGVDMTKPFGIDFVCGAPTQEAAQNIGSEAEKLGFTVRIVEEEPIEGEEDNDEDCWSIYCVARIVPTLENILDLEDQLDVIAEKHSGYYDGFSNHDRFPTDRKDSYS